MIQFPAGRFEPQKHSSFKDVAVAELEEEAGIKITKKDLIFIGKIAEGTTKSTAVAQAYLTTNAKFNSKQKLDDNEEIEMLLYSANQIDQMIKNGEIWDATAIAIWQLAKLKGLISV